jgi:hypothetical protein
VSHVLDLQTVEMPQLGGGTEWEVDFCPSTPSLLCQEPSAISIVLCCN